MFLIKTKDASFLGFSHGLKFVDGKAKTGDKYLAERMKRKGYIVEQVSQHAPEADAENTSAKRGKK